MKLIVQIPCYNEEATLPQTVADIPRAIDGIDTVEILIIDDGSTDRTIEVALELGVDHIVRNKKNLGLARTFRRGLETALSLGADIIVNTDGDNQYVGADIAKLVCPIINGEADITIGDRQTGQVAEFSWVKKRLQRLGSTVVRNLSDVDVPDAVSGFRAISREAAFRINIVSPFSYTTEMLIQAGKKHMAVISIPIRTNPKTRESRLFKSMFNFIERQLTTVIRMYSMYQPLRVFFFIGLLFTIIGLLPIVRFLILFLIQGSAGHIQSLVLGSGLVLIGVFTFMIGLVADLINFNRQLIELTLEKVRKLEVGETDRSRQDHANKREQP